MKLQKIFSFSVIVASLVGAQEPSAFNAGGVAPQKTQSEMMDERLFKLSSQIKSIEESQEGLRSVFEGQTQKVQELVNGLDLLKGENAASIGEVRTHVDSNFALQNENIEKIKQSISALGALIKKTNTQMQSEIDGLKEQIASLQTAQKSTAKVESKATKKVENTESQNAEIAKNVDNAIAEMTTTTEVESKVANTKTDIKAEIKTQEAPQNTIKLLDSTSEVPIPVVPLNTAESQTISQVTPDATINAQNITRATETEPLNVQDKATEQPKEIQQETPQNTQESQSAIAKENPQEEKAKEKQETDKKESKKSEAKTDLTKIPLADVYKQGEEFYKNKSYAKADEYLQFAVKGSYKPARGNYLLGEIAFEEKRYEDAIYYYKTSATRYDKADYMPRLMLNSAKSFNAIKEKENAKRFLDTLISLYPKSNEAKEAKNLLKSF